MLKQFFILFTIASICVSCDKTYETIYQCAAVPEKTERGEDTLMKDSSANFNFSRLRKPNSGGISCHYLFEPGKPQSEYYVVFHGRIRTNYAQSNAFINLSSIDVDGNIINWNSSSLKYFVTDTDQWCWFKDSILIKYESWNKPYKMVNVFPFLGPSASENFDVDTLFVELKERKL